MFSKQVIGTATTRVFIGIFAAHVLAIFLRDTVVELPLLVLVACALGYLAFRSLEWSMVVAFTELFTGGHGHLLSADVFGFSLSLRMAIFLGVMIGWGVTVLRKQRTLSWNLERDLPWVVLAFAVLLGTVTGFMNHTVGKVFDDMNGYVVMAYLLPVLSLHRNAETKRMLLQTLFASTIWLVLFTLVLSYLFTHLDGKSLAHVYTFVRDSRLAEVTLQTVSNTEGVVTNIRAAAVLGADGYWYRIFLQSQFFLIAMGSVLLAGMLTAWRKQRVPSLLTLSFIGVIAALLLSMSRSFALGAAMAIALIGLHALKTMPVSHVLLRSVYAVLLGLVGLAVAYTSVAIPIPQQPNIQDAAFYSTSAGTGRAVAVSSRWALLGPMMEAINTSPVLGSGFGTEVTYVSDDPRVRAEFDGGVITTYRFEWGYQDAWLKMGLAGLLAFFLIALSLGKATYVTANAHGYSWIVVGLGAGVAALYVAHIFSPFLNHPIGIGYLIFVIPFLDFKKREQKKERPNGRLIEATNISLQMNPVVQKELSS